MNKLDKILEQFSDYGHHDNNGYGDCSTCKKVAKAKQAIQQELLKARIDELLRFDTDEDTYRLLRLAELRDLQAKLKENSDGNI